MTHQGEASRRGMLFSPRVIFWGAVVAFIAPGAAAFILTSDASTTIFAGLICLTFYGVVVGTIRARRRFNAHSVVHKETP